MGDFVTAGHKILDEENESQIQQNYSVAVQDFATKIQSYPCNKQCAQENMPCLRWFLLPDTNPKTSYVDNPLESI